MPSLDKIVQHWRDQRPDPTYQDRLSASGTGDPFCFRCGWFPPSADPYGATPWRYCSRWLDRAHLEDHAGGGNEDVSNLIPLCFLCHKEMPDHDAGQRDQALQWVKAGYQRRWEWQFFTDAFGIDLPGRQKIERAWFRLLEAVAA